MSAHCVRRLFKGTREREREMYTNSKQSRKIYKQANKLERNVYTNRYTGEKERERENAVLFPSR